MTDVTQMTESFEEAMAGDAFNWCRYHKALKLAIDAHDDQIYGQVPYLHHLLAVERQLYIYCFHPLTPESMRKFPLKVCEDILIACILHDTVEDTDVTVEQLRDQFGDRVASLVWAVTNGEGETRKEKFASVYPKIRDTQYAIVVKLSDRIANYESCMDFRLTKDRHRVGKLLAMYRSEYPNFKDNLYNPDHKHLSHMWTRLELLSNGYTP